jgi:hypothetical protein
MKTRNCMDCSLADHTGERLICTVGHKPRFYLPTGNPHWSSDDWGWKRKCQDFKAGTPLGIKVCEISLPTPANHVVNRLQQC